MAKVSILFMLFLHLLFTGITAVIHGSIVSLHNENANNECGITSYYTDDTNRLISNGEETLPGQWPWLVALNSLINDELVNKFICAGSVLTTKHVITAAHCLKLNFIGNNTREPDNLYVAFGQFTLRQWHEKGTINREVASYKIHPDYAHAITGDSNLAILTLRTSVEYSPFIRPICLWSGSTTLQNIIDKIGYVVGWGQDKFGHSNTGEPRMVRVPIVSQEVCLWSHPIFVSLTSNRTFCAGLQGENNSCNGDSGSGLILFDATMNRYQLRGIVSRIVFGNDSFSCDPTKYVVYVDVAKYVSWIQQQIST